MADAMMRFMEAVQALLVSLRGHPITLTDGYCDVAIEIAATRAAPHEPVTDLLASTEALLGDLDDRSLSGTAEWEECSQALAALRGVAA